MNHADPSQRRPVRKRSATWGAALCLLAFVGSGSTTVLADDVGDEAAQRSVLAHRGLGQTFDVEGVENDTCTAEIIHEPEHSYLENTIEGMRAAFDAGADVVEFDVHMTADDQFAVFHDWDLDCRTDMSGTTRDFTMAELRGADVGHGYTADGGETYPFRGEGVGLMPELGEVVDAFSEESLLLHIKSEDPAEGELLADRLQDLPQEQLERFSVYGGDAPIESLRERMPDLRVMSKQSMTDCLTDYTATGAAGDVPESCTGTQLHVPESHGPLLPGWPGTFTQRMAEVDTRVVLVAGDGGFSEGFDTPESLDRVPDDFHGLIWTNRAHEMADLIHAS